MCGLNGIFAYHSAASAPQDVELLSTRDAMEARGPDGAGAWWSRNRRCALGHRRLSIIDLSDRAAQPMMSRDGGLAIVFNGEIYNSPELRIALQAKGIAFGTTSDTEVLLCLYAVYGRDMVDHLRGMFAFAIWDDLRQGLFLARDPYGIKPLYTANDGWTFRFASQVKALLAGGKVSRDPEPAGVVGFQVFGSVPEPFTVYRDIRALPAGHTQWVDKTGAFEPRSFVNLSRLLRAGVERCASEQDAGIRIRDAVRDSVRQHLLADVEVGVFLSAGIDSGAVLGLMRDAGQNEIRAITLAFEEFRGTDEDESPLAASVAQRYGAAHLVRQVGEQEFRRDVDAILTAMDQPSIDGVNTWFVAKAAKDAGLKVALSGLGGDELLAGYPSFTDVPRWRRRYGALSAVPGFGSISRKLMRLFAPELARRKPKALGVFDYCSSWAGAYLLRRALFLPHELAATIDPALLRLGLERLQPLRLLGAHLDPDPGTDTGRICALESAHYMRNQLLRDADWAGMAHGVEIRTPLVDVVLLRRLAPVIAGLAPGKGKAALAVAPSTPLPNAVMTRAKTGFGVPTGAWMNALAAGSSAGRGSKGAVSRRWSEFVLGGYNTLKFGRNAPALLSA